MTDFLVQYGPASRRMPSHPAGGCSEEETVEITFSDGRALHIALRQGPIDRPGDLVTSNHLALAWVGRWRAPGDSSLARREPSRWLCEAWRRRGVGLFDSLQGILAAALFDLHTGALYCFRDKMGLVTMSFARRGRQKVVVSTDLEWLQEATGAVEPNLRRLTAFMADSDDEDRDDFFAGHYRVRPGEAVRWNAGLDERVETYWKPAHAPLAKPDDAPRLLRQTLEEVLEAGAPGPRVVSMSGGLDSPSMAALELGRGGDAYGSERPLNVTSMIAPGLPRAHEEPQILDIARALPLNVHFFPIDGRWPLKDLTVHLDHLALGPHVHPEEGYMRAYQAWIRQRFGDVTVLYGHGADDALLCPTTRYRRYLMEVGAWGELARHFPTAPAATARQLAGYAVERTGLKPWLRPLRRAPAADRVLVEMPWRVPASWMHRPAWPERSPPPSPSDWAEERRRRLRSWRWELVCRTLDRETRRSGLRNFYPMLDTQLWELCFKLTPRELARGGMSKAVLRNAMEDRLPASVAHRPKHSSFDAIVEKGLAQREVATVEALFGPSRLAQAEIIDASIFLDVYARYRAASPTALGRPYRGSLSLWHTVAAELWLRALDGS